MRWVVRTVIFDRLYLAHIPLVTTRYLAHAFWRRKKSCRFVTWSWRNKWNLFFSGCIQLPQSVHPVSDCRSLYRHFASRVGFAFVSRFVTILIACMLLSFCCIILSEVMKTMLRSSECRRCEAPRPKVRSCAAPAMSYWIRHIPVDREPKQLYRCNFTFVIVYVVCCVEMGMMF